MNIAFEEKEYNLKRAKEFIKQAAREKADIILFPEMSFTGFSMDVERMGETDDYTKAQISQAARANGIAVGFGVTLINEGKGENHYIICNKDGEPVSDYIKLHSFSIGGELKQFRKGSKLARTSLCGHSISTFICYDLRFPEIFRAAADESSIITVAANWPKSRRMHWKSLLRARAIENQSYIIGINCTGKQGEIEYGGESSVISPSGELMYEAGEAEELFYCEIPDNVDEIRKNFPVLEDRRAEFYRSII